MQRIIVTKKEGRPMSFIVANLKKGRKYYSFNIIGIRGKVKALIECVTICEDLQVDAPVLDNLGRKMENYSYL